MKFSKSELRIEDEKGPAVGLTVFLYLKPSEAQLLTKVVNENPMFGLGLIDNQLSLSIAAGTIGHFVKQMTGNLNRSIPGNDVSDAHVKLKVDIINLLEKFKKYEEANSLSLGSSGKDPLYKQNKTTLINTLNEQFKKKEYPKISTSTLAENYVEAIQLYKSGKDLEKTKSCLESFLQNTHDMLPDRRETLQEKISDKVQTRGNDNVFSMAASLIDNIDKITELKSRSPSPVPISSFRPGAGA